MHKQPKPPDKRGSPDLRFVLCLLHTGNGIDVPQSASLLPPPPPILPYSHPAPTPCHRRFSTQDTFPGRGRWTDPIQVRPYAACNKHQGPHLALTNLPVHTLSAFLPRVCTKRPSCGKAILWLRWPDIDDCASQVPRKPREGGLPCSPSAADVQVLDGHWSPRGGQLAITDTAGQLHLYGVPVAAARDVMARVPYDQFLATDYNNLIRDVNGWVDAAASGAMRYLQ